ncbi:hypothetical protein IJT17_02790 [bacterium]|nr:hypothetical protein [bacterium]
MASLQMFTFTFPWWASLLIILFFVYLAIAGNIDPDFYLPIHYIPMRILSGAVLLGIVGFILPRVRFSLKGIPLITDYIGVLPSGKEMALFVAGVGIVLSLITWGIYAVVRPKEMRQGSRQDQSGNSND